MYMKNKQNSSSVKVCTLARANLQSAWSLLKLNSGTDCKSAPEKDKTLPYRFDENAPLSRLIEEFFSLI